LQARGDVVVVGGGVIGCAVAYYVARMGAKVVLVERAMVGSGASSANPGSIAMATKKGGLLLALAMASQRMHAKLADDLGTDTEYGVEGNLIIAENEQEVNYLHELYSAQRAAGVPVQMVDGARARELNPLLEGPVECAIYCGTDAHANPFKVTQGYAVAAQNLGAKVLPGTTIESIDTSDGRVTGVKTSAGTIRADWVINAAGAWSPDVGRMVDVTHEVVPKRGQILVLEAVEGLPAVRVSGASQLLAKHAGPSSSGKTTVSLSYTRKARSGTVLLGSTNEYAGFDAVNTRDATIGIAQVTSRFMPRLASLRVVRGWAGLRPFCAAGPQLGYVGGPRGYLVATGHGGDGMALSPVTGRYLAEVVARDRDALSINDFLDVLKAEAAAAS
jgi:glycine/D-amino acid oxidase-like deaminating enzyme